MNKETEKGKKFAIIDGKSVFYRGYYAMPNLTAKDGTPTGGVFGFATMALEVIRRLKPDYVAVAWDKPKTNIRRRVAMYPEYKAGRKPAPADFYEQIPVLQQLLEAFGWPLYELDDYEADDIMGTLALQANEKGLETMLITSDLDMLQLVNEQVRVYALKTGLSNIELYSPKTFEAKYGIKVNQFLDLKSLKGDSSDNIPGVPGIGEKGALDLLKQFDTLDGVYDNLALVKESTRKKLEAGKQLAYLSKDLARIWTDAPITLDLKEVDGSKAQPDKVLDLLQSLQFKSLVRHLPEVMQVAITNHQASSSPDALKIGKAVYVNSKEKLDHIKLDPKAIFVHCFLAGKHGHDPLVIALSGLSSDKVYIIDVGSIDKAFVSEALKAHITANTHLIGYDVKSAIKVFMKLGLPITAVHHDVQVASFLIDPLERTNNLTELVSNELNYDGSGFDNLDPESMIGCEAEIISLIKALYYRQISQFSQLPKLAALAKDVEWPIIPVLAKMEYTGIELDTVYLKKFSIEIDDLISDYEQQIFGHVDQEFNIGSPSQLADILFDKLKLPTTGIKKGKSGYSTAARQLDKLRGTHPVIDLISQYREVAKLKNTYVDTLPKLVDKRSRLHTTFNLTIAQTGRLSSTDPNLQNIPIRTDLGRHIRTAFVAGKGKRLVSADYSQFELRLAAILAKDDELIDMFNRGADIHSATAAQVYGREQEDVTKQMRRAAKVINFGIIYGMSPHGLSVATGMTMDQATSFIDRYKALRQPLFDYMDRVKDQARKNGYVETLFGRRRPSPDIHSSNFVVRQAAERAAINMPIQGTEADLMKMAMIKVEELLANQHNDCNMLLQIHDSILVECPEEVADDIGNLLEETMESIYELPVRLEVDVTIGNNWGEL
jgi:DNA polymerase-1